MPHPTRPGVRLLTLAALLAAGPAFAADRTGEEVYRQECARCHGKQGEGSKKYPQPLVGEKSPGQLAAAIAKTMPENDPGSLSPEDVKKVTTYVYDTFYSADAVTRNKPPRIELARLTVRQYRNAVADVVAAFRPPYKPDDRRGLHGEYFNSRGFQPNKKQLDRTDPEVRFDFGKAGPDKSFDAHQFAVRWEGSVLAPETGEYQFVVRTDHAARLWVNDPFKPLIDAWVKSGSDTEYRSSIFLVAGRWYPIRLEFSKAKQGVDDSKKQKAPPPPKPAGVALLWKLPGRADEVIPSRHLSPAHAAESFVLTSPFPPDDRSLGWERGTAVSKAWDAATTDAAIETAGYVMAHLDELAGVKVPERRRGPNSGNPAGISLDGDKDAKPDPERDRKLREFCRKFAERAFRRPLTPELAKVYVERQFAETTKREEAVKRVLLFVLKSPRFLYREVGGGPEQYDVAARLSFALWDSIPDPELLDAAAAGKLATREQVERQAERMMNDPRTKAKLRGFLLKWLKVDQAPEMAKDPKRFPGFDAAVTSDLRESLDLFLDDAVWGAGDFRQLLLADELYLNGRLAKFYGAPGADDGPKVVKRPEPGFLGALFPPPPQFVPPASSFQKVKLNPQQRAGVLTHPYLMAAFAYTAESSPIHRGVFLVRGILGLPLRPPVDAFTPLPAELHPNLTTRERVALQTKPAACVSCHGVINPLGFTLERFDAVGRYRERENGKPVDSSGSYQTRSGEVVKFSGVRDLAKFLADSPEVHAAFATQLFHHLAQQPVRAYGPQTPDRLRDFFAANGFNIRRLAVEVATTAALVGRDAKPPDKPPGGR